MSDISAGNSTINTILNGLRDPKSAPWFLAFVCVVLVGSGAYWYNKNYLFTYNEAVTHSRDLLEVLNRQIQNSSNTINELNKSLDLANTRAQILQNRIDVISRELLDYKREHEEFRSRITDLEKNINKIETRQQLYHK